MKKSLLFICLIAILAACGTPTPAPLPPTQAPAATATPVELPKINTVELDKPTLARYEGLAIKLDLEAQYTNPFDAREVRLEALFTAPDGSAMTVPGFWDAESAWQVRFTPWQEGTWQYQLTVSDARGSSQPATGEFSVTASDLHGWLQIGSQVNPAYSPRYLAHHDGTPFYGIGYCEALNILIDGFDASRGVVLFENMQAQGANFVVWWPLYTNSPVNNNYDQYSLSNLKTIDLIVKDAEKKGIFLVFTVWDHPNLRAKGHAWGDGKWEGNNGFRKLGEIDSFFIDEEAWAWQENLYRYTIARWGYSTAIGLWQTASEINGTNAYDQTNPWHARVNAYFVENDPYRHPTTASMSGDMNWPEGFAVMDAPQVHVYALENDPVKTADIIAGWTTTMWNEAEKPNWVGEYGTQGNSYYPEMAHNAIWAALASGAAMTPAEWNSGGSWGRITPEMAADLQRLNQFVAGIPLVKWNPLPLQIAPSDPQVRGWGVAGADGGLLWVQDFALEGQGMDEVRKNETVRAGVQAEVQGLAEGVYQVTPFDTWQGIFLEPFEVTCSAGQACTLSLPDFKADMAFKLERK